jgi:hypothetical protein
MTLGNEPFDRLAPAYGWTPEWNDVLARAGVTRSARRSVKRPLLIAVVVLVAVLVPLAAIGAGNHWWFLKFGGPTPAKAPVVVKEGVWGNRRWQLIAYPSTTDGLCMAMAPSSAAIPGRGAMACVPFAGVARTPSTKPSPDMTITFLMSGAAAGLPAYIAGPVISTASNVELRFSNGTILRASTFAGAGALSRVRFYATRLPTDVVKLLRPPTRTGKQHMYPLNWAAGLDAHGNVVACLAPLESTDGISPLSACH